MNLPSGGAVHVNESGAGRPVLFLHGVAGGAWSWGPQVAALAGIGPALAWDARGHGAARRVADAGLGDYWRDAGEALDAVHDRFGRAPVVAGHSMGGLLAMALAADRPGDVAGLFLVEPVYAPRGGAHLGGAAASVARTLLGPLVGALERDGPIVRRLAQAAFRAAFSDRVAMARAWPQQRRQVPLEYPKMIYEAFEGPSDFSSRAFADEIAAPVALVEGSVARRGPRFPELVTSLRARLGERFSYHVIEGGHYLQLDRPDLVNDLLVRCLRRVR